MTAFERGYADFLAGVSLEDNPFDEKTCQWSTNKWRAGWKAARKNRQEKLQWV
jgi:ribosome modulation factor